MSEPDERQPSITWHSISGEKGVYTTDEFIAMLDASWHRPSAYVRRFFLRIVEWLPARLSDVRAFIQRGHRGWADRDTWNADY